MDNPTVWRRSVDPLENNLICDAIDSYLSSEDPTDISEGIRAAEREDHVVNFTRYLLRART